MWEILSDSISCKWDHNCTRDSCDGCKDLNYEVDAGRFNDYLIAALSGCEERID